MYKHTEERWFKGYEIIMTMLGGKPKKKKKTIAEPTIGQPIETVFKPQDEYSNLSPQEQGKLSQNMKSWHQGALKRLFSGTSL